MLRHKHILFFIYLWTLLSPVCVLATLPDYANNRPLPSLAPMLNKAMPAVVNISTRTEIKTRENPLLNDPVFRHFFQQRGRPQKRHSQSLGSGVIIDASNGYLLTNNHVIDKADEIMVTLHDGRQLSAQLIGTDPESDIAVIQISPENLTALPIADSTTLRVGDFAVAIGNPFGLGQTVTSGIISALGRSGLGIEGYEDFIQTDASINPGNSGGALVNLRGELIGINTAILAPSGGNVGIGFAIPSNMAIKLKNALIEHGEVRRGLLGVSVQDLTPQLARAFELKRNQGAIVSSVQPDSPAEKAGLEPGDIITTVNGRTIKNSDSLRNAVGLLQLGDQVTLGIVRDKKRIELKARIAKAIKQTLPGKQFHSDLAGAILANTAKNQIEGVIFDAIETGSPAWTIGLRPGDIIVSANRYRIHTLEELQATAKARRELLINIRRGNEAFFLVLR